MSDFYLPASRDPINQSHLWRTGKPISDLLRLTPIPNPKKPEKPAWEKSKE